MNIYALIPARSGSKRVKDKNIRMLAGIPLLVYSVRTAIQCNLPVWVSTDSEKYGRIASEAGANVLTRPDYLCGDDAGDREVIVHFLSQHPCYFVVYLRPTTPFRDPAVVTRAIDEFLKSGNDSMRSVEEMSESAYKCFEIENGMLEPVYYVSKGPEVGDITDSPNQECPKTYHPNGYVDILRSEVVLSGGSIWGSKKMAFITEKTIEIDSEHDFWLAEQWLRSNVKA